MTALLSLRNLGLGVLSWLVPFAASIVFFDSSGALRIPQPLFKSLMIVVFGGIGVALLVIAFRRFSPTARNGMALGGLWLLINLVLDIAVLLPMSGMSLGLYLEDIGLRYLLMPIIGLGMGLIADRVRQPLSAT